MHRVTTQENNSRKDTRTKRERQLTKGFSAKSGSGEERMLDPSGHNK